MKQKGERRKRQREFVSPALAALIARIKPQDDSSASLRFLMTFSTNNAAGNNNEGDVVAPVIEGDELTRLCKELGEGITGDDIWAIIRRLPHSQSTRERIEITELCFAIGQAAAPADAHERRRNVGNMLLIDESAPLIKYYKGERFAALLGILDGAAIEREWADFLKCVSSPLPMTLRVHNNESVLRRVADHFLQNDPVVSAVIGPVAPFALSNIGIFGCSHALYHANSRVAFICRSLHAASAVSFQEVVSAIPVAVADIQPYHSVLDMCAAPGSKTLQILDEMLQYGWENSAVSEGVVIANEKDCAKATQVLPARLKRFHAPNVICTRCDAVQWPKFFSVAMDSNLVERKFDRIVCDVPCSGDGTMRKEPSLVSSWSSGYVKSLLPTQRALLRRGLDLLKEGGILVYSTCSMQPRENEEVVCAGLELFGASVELLDVPSILKSHNVSFHSLGGLVSPDASHLRNGKLPTSYDPRKVLRILPHKDDTGGFFVAAFRKLSTPGLPSLSVHPEKLNHWMKGKLWLPVARNDDEWCNITQFYGLDSDCEQNFYYYDRNNESYGPEQPETGGSSDTAVHVGLVPVYHLNPNGGPRRRIVLVTRAVARMLFDARPYKGPGVEVVSTGVRAFEAYDGKYLSGAKCRWRAVVESASYLAPRMRLRKLILNADDQPEMVKKLLSNGFVWLLDYWNAIFCHTSSNCSGLLTCADGCLREDFAVEKKEETPAQTAPQSLAEGLVVGGVLLGLKGGLLSSDNDVWWLSATLSSTKLEVAVDVSLRTFGLLILLGIQPDGGTSTSDANSVEMD
ncbi:putative 16S rRNA methyltransferase RsmB F [Trypanosoma vivax]|uniref:Putative methyltransferase n=1 Tax=Trypanosoma vivax (strain Y486) TaxID=1055687 RepID=G0U458_TRYVY|nr:putative methyltransferase [Trypanosoma vivax]KAH8611313.1 putative 16S rRNA methyltransferase RsmB F [Trypanosoma vivax]CCC52220.1 putative methyltransferase [Trypanosoma vivax Y486]